MQKYDLDAAKYIVKGFVSDWTEIRGDGLHIKKGYFENDPSQDVFHWTPACDMDWPGSPDPLKAPSLPIEFSANELAAFMLSGPGALVASYYGTWDHGPDEGMLEAMGLQAREPRKALREAYEAYRNAEQVVGKLDEVLQQQAHELQSSLHQANLEANALQKVLESGTSEAERSARRDVARASVAALEAQADGTTTRAKNELVAWRKAMVNQLLRPVDAPHSGIRTTPPDPIDGDNDHEQAAFERYKKLLRAVRLDQSRVAAGIEHLASLRKTVENHDKMLAALAEFGQINKRLAFLDSGMSVDAQHAAEVSFTIEETRESRVGHDSPSAYDVAKRADEIRAANEEVDALIAAPQTHAPEQDTATPATVVIHSTKVRRNILTPVIELAQLKCRNPKDTAEVWAALLVLAEAKEAPLLGTVDEGLQYLEKGNVAYLSRDALRKRLAR